MVADAGGPVFASDYANDELRGLHHLLHNLDAPMEPAQVHALRTGTRRAEAILHVIGATGAAHPRRFRKALQRIRRSAGAVRDLDVLLGFLQTLPPAGNPAPLTRFMERISRKRDRAVRELRLTLKENARHLVGGLQAMEHTLAAGHSRISQKGWSAKAASLAAEHRRTLAAWPRLNEKTLHGFRIHARQLRDALLLDQSPAADELRQATAVKDSLGAWHDWSVLSAMARKGKKIASQPLVRRIATIEEARCAAALRKAMAFRQFLRAVPQAPKK
jgi:CHAD domain-containing protein